MLTACGNQVPDPAQHAVSESVEDFEEHEGDWDYAEPDTPACHSYLERESAPFAALEDEDATSFERTYEKTADDGTLRSVMVRVEHRTDGKRFDTALPLFDETYQGSDWTDCMAARFAVEHAQGIPPASRVDRGYSWALRLVYSTGEVYRYDVTVWQSGNQTVWLYTFGDDIDEVVEWARTVQRDTATGVARGEDP